MRETCSNIQRILLKGSLGEIFWKSFIGGRVGWKFSIVEKLRNFFSPEEAR